MSETPQPPPSIPRRAGWLTVLMILIGVVLLLPGVCAGFFVIEFIRTPGNGRIDPMFIQLWLACFAVAAGGIALIWWAIRRPSR